MTMTKVEKLVAAAWKVERAYSAYLDSDVIDDLADAIGELRVAVEPFR